MNLGVQIFVRVPALSTSVHMPRSGMAGPQGHLMCDFFLSFFFFFEEPPDCFSTAAAEFYTPTSEADVLQLPSTPANMFVSVFGNSHLIECEVAL